MTRPRRPPLPDESQTPGAQGSITSTRMDAAATASSVAPRQDATLNIPLPLIKLAANNQRDCLTCFSPIQHRNIARVICPPTVQSGSRCSLMERGSRPAARTTRPVSRGPDTRDYGFGARLLEVPAGIGLKQNSWIIRWTSRARELVTGLARPRVAALVSGDAIAHECDEPGARSRQMVPRCPSRDIDGDSIMSCTVNHSARRGVARGE